MELSIIIPVFNEEANVLPLAREVIKALGSTASDFEVLFVDDCSSDLTWDRVKEAQQLDRRIRGVRHRENRGQSAAVWTGIQHTQSPIIGTLDGDCQNDPTDFARMLKGLQSADMVTGTRANRQDSWLRRVSSKVARSARRAALKVDIHDSGCAMRVFKREVLSAAIPFNGLHRFLPILVASAGFRVLQVPVNHRPRTAGVSKYGLGNRLWRGMADLYGVSWFQKRRFKPIGVDVLENRK